MKTFLASSLLLASMASFGTVNYKCDFKSEDGKVYTQSKLTESTTADGKYIIVKAETVVGPDIWTNDILIKNADGTIPKSGKINIPEEDTGLGYKRDYSYSFEQKLEGIKVSRIITADKNHPWQDTTTFNLEIDSNDGSIMTFKIKETLREPRKFFPGSKVIGVNNLKCNL